MSSKPPRLKNNATIGAYRILQFVGDDDTRSLYLASSSGAQEIYWLFESNLEIAQIGTSTGERDAFRFKGKNYLAASVSGTSVAMLTNWIDLIDSAFIVPRWITLAQQVGFQHANGRVYQQSIPFDLQNILFSEQAQLLPMSFVNSTANSIPFPSPETASGSLSPASDVYSLGASLAALLGNASSGVSSLKIGSPKRQLQVHPDLLGILKKATESDPAKRYKDANALAIALSRVTPRSSPPKVKSVARRSLPLINFVPIILVLLIILLGGLIWRGVYTPSTFGLFRQPTQIIDTPEALPKGSLSFDPLNISFSQDKMGLVDLRLSKGGRPIPYTSPVNFELEVDGQPVGPLTVQEGSPSSSSSQDLGVYHLGFDSSSFSTSRGTYRVTAKVIGGAISRTIYFDNATQEASNLIPTDQGGLSQFSITGVQVDPGRYPDLTLYFGLSGSRGEVGRLKGLVVAQIMQDGQEVGEFLITPVDPTQNPVTVALAIDVSGSMQGEPIAKAQEAAGEFVGELAPKDSACIYSFSTYISRLMKCSTDRGSAVAAIGEMHAGGNTALYDALTIIAGDMAKLAGRKDVVVLSDGADTGSQSKQDEALAQLKPLNLPIYTIGLTSPQFRGSVLQEFSQGTGGAYLQAPSTADLRSLYASINNQLKNEYELDFKSLFPDRNGGSISIRLIQGTEMIETSHPFLVPTK